MDLSFTPDQDALREATTRLYAKESHGERVREAEADGLRSGALGRRRGHGPADHGAARGGRRRRAPRSPTWPPPSRCTAPTSARCRWSRRRSPPGCWPAVGGADDAPGGGRRRRRRDPGPAPGAGGTARARARAPRSPASWSPSTATGSSPLAAPTVRARRTLAGLAVGRRRPDRRRRAGRGPRRASPPTSRALDEWRALTAVAQAGLARATLDVGVQYAKDRHQFGVPIGSFQTLQHRFADLHTRVDGSRLLAYEAVWALDEDDADARRAGRPGVVVVRRGRRRGGRVQPPRPRRLRLHARVRRAAARAAGQGHPPARSATRAHELQRIAEHRWGDARPAEPVAAATARPTRRGMDFRFEPETEAFRARGARLHRASTSTTRSSTGPTPPAPCTTGASTGRCAHAGYLAAGWPDRGRRPRAQRHRPVPARRRSSTAPARRSTASASPPWSAPRCCVCGTDEQQATVVPRILAGEVHVLPRLQRARRRLRRRRRRHQGACATATTG